MTFTIQYGAEPDILLAAKNYGANRCAGRPSDQPMLTKVDFNG